MGDERFFEFRVRIVENLEYILWFGVEDTHSVREGDAVLDLIAVFPGPTRTPCPQATK